MINVKEPPYNAVGDGVTDDTAALTAAIAASANDTCLIPPGTYMVNQSGVPLVSGVRIETEGRPTLKAIGPFAHTYDGLLNARDDNDWSVRGLTIDMNGGIGTGIKAYSCERWDVTDCQILNIAINGIMAQGGSDFRIDRNYLVNSVPNTQVQNTAIFCTAAGTDVCRYYYITQNRVIGSSINAEGHDGIVSQNLVTGSQFGCGIISTVDSERLIIIDNIASGGRGFDINHTWIEGFELWGKNHIIRGNIAYGNDGGGLSVGASNSVIAENLCYDNGVASGNGGINLRYMNVSNAIGSIVIGNRCFDSQGANGTQGYGLVYQRASLMPPAIRLGANNLNGNKLGPTHTNP
jgi:N terminal extension of bacteriophage endosialidase.